jgi:CBS domain-containing protein
MLAEARKRLETISGDTPLSEAARLLCLEHITLVAVCDADGRLAGVITDSDIVQCVAGCHPGCRRPACCLDAATAMAREVVACRVENPLIEVWSVMRQRDLRHIPVVDADDRPIGILYARDMLKRLYESTLHEERLMQDYFFGLGYH